MSYKVLTLKETQLWSEMLSRLPIDQQDVYFTPEYYSLYQNYGDGEACCFVFEENGELAMYPFLKNSINKLGYELDRNYYDIQGAYGYNGVVTSNKSLQFLNSFYTNFSRWCIDNHIIAEFTRFSPFLNNHVLAAQQMRTFYSRNTVCLDLSLSEDDIWMKQFSSKNRNEIRKAEKEGVRIVESKNYEIFRELYNSTMINVGAEDYYYFTQEYYDEISKSLKDNCILCLAIYEGKAIAGSMFMFSKYYAHYHLSARDKNYSRLSANNYILNYGVKKAKERGCRFFHFGGGTDGNIDNSLLKFKMSFSKTLTDFYIGKCIHNQSVYDEVVRQWQAKHPESYEKNKVKLLGYREI